MTNRAIIFQPHKWKTGIFAHRGFSTIFFGTCAILLAGFAGQPIAQQSTKTKTSDISIENVPMKVEILPQIPDRLSGTGKGGSSNSASFDFIAAAVQCIINAPGISVDFSSKSQTVNLCDSTIAEQYIFLLDFNLAQDDKGHPYINFSSTYS
ncbi:hypothetical protein BDZ45DRAFT_753730 [Acephala macrosclerotiorum]|nr:hypothetical protein BDZ45DRAFT_753730 [Acephala macrosclerotiorum]